MADESFLKQFFRKLVWAIVPIFVGSVAVSDRLRTYFSLLTSSYDRWLFVESLLITVALYCAGQMFGIWRGVANFRRGEVSPFLDLRIRMYLGWLWRGALLILPAICGGLYYGYYSHWFYETEKFRDDEVGVLIADFREVALDGYIPYAKYSSWLKEELPGALLQCAAPIPVGFKSTKAFFSSANEAKKYAHAMRAIVVIWGEVFKSNNEILVKPKINIAGWVEIGFGNKFSWDLDILCNQSERWRLDGSAMSLDNLKVRLQEMLIVPVYSKLSGSSGPSTEYRSWAECTLDKFKLASALLRSLLMANLGVSYVEDGDHDAAISWFTKAGALAEDFDLPDEDKAKYMALIEVNLAKCYWTKNEDDSLDAHFWKAWYHHPLVVLQDSLMSEVLWTAVANSRDMQTDSIKNRLQLLWDYRPDSVIGEFLLDLYDFEKQSPPGGLHKTYDSLYGGRGNTR